MPVEPKDVRESTSPQPRKEELSHKGDSLRIDPSSTDSILKEHPLKQKKNDTFSKEARLLTTGSFNRVMEKGKRTVTRNLTVFWLSSVSSSSDITSKLPKAPLRIGITVSKKVDKRASRRNLIKRRIRELFRTEIQHTNLSGDLVLIARPQPEGEIPTFEQIRKEVLQVIRRIENHAA